jgi:hypothetical protein
VAPCILFPGSEGLARLPSPTIAGQGIKVGSIRIIMAVCDAAMFCYNVVLVNRLIKISVAGSHCYKEDRLQWFKTAISYILNHC